MLVTLLVESSARAAEPELVRVDYHADDSCPNADAFERAVLLRTNRARTAREREHEPARTFHVTITREGDRVRGEFSVTDAQDAEQTSSARSVESATCGEVFDALLLFASLSVDANASSQETTPAPNQPVTIAPPTSTPEQRAGPRVPGTVDRSGDSPVRHFRWVTGFDGGALSAGTTQSALVLEPFIETRWQRAIDAGLDVSPTLRLALSMFGGDSSPAEDGYAHLRWTLGRLDGCPLALVAAGSLRLRPCLSFSGGVLSAVGREIAQPTSHQLTWWALGGALRAEWNPNAFGVEMSAGLEAPLQRTQLYFEPAADVYRPPAVFERVTLGVSYHFL